MTIDQAGGHQQKAIMVGDSITDIDTARNANLPVIAVNFGYSETELSALNPDALIEHYDHLYDAVIMLNQKQRN